MMRDEEIINKSNFLRYDEELSRELEKKVFFANNPDYKETEYYESNNSSCELPKQQPKKKRKKERNHSPLTKLWENRGPISLYSSPGDSTFSLTFCNYKKLDYFALDKFFKQFGQYASARELDENLVRVRYHKEEAIRNCYNALKKDPKHKVTVLLDVDKYFMMKRKQTNIRGFRRNCKSGYDNSVLDSNKTSDRMEKALARESEIGFRRIDPPQRSGPRIEPRKPRIGYYKGNIVVEPEEPYVNKYLRPPDFELEKKLEEIKLENKSKQSHNVLLYQSSLCDSDDLPQFLCNSISENNMQSQPRKKPEESIFSKTWNTSHHTQGCFNSGSENSLDHNLQWSNSKLVNVAKNRNKGQSQWSYDNSDTETKFEDMPPLISVFDLYAMGLRKNKEEQKRYQMLPG